MLRRNNALSLIFRAPRLQRRRGCIPRAAERAEVNPFLRYGYPLSRLLGVTEV